MKTIETVRFLEDREVRDHEGVVTARFTAGTTYALPPRSAARWVRRGAAEYTAPEFEPTPEPAPEPTPEPTREPEPEPTPEPTQPPKRARKKAKKG